MKVVLLALGILCTLFYTAKASTEFFSVYDLGISNPDGIYNDLLWYGSAIMAINRSELGIRLERYTEDLTGRFGNGLVIDYGGRNEVSVITIVKPRVCEKRFMIWIRGNSSINTTCGLLCLNDFKWTLECRDLFGTDHFVDVVKLDGNSVLILALSFLSVEGALAIRFLWKEGDGTPDQYTQRFSRINYRNFVSEARISYGAYTGELYYLAFLEGSLNIQTFTVYANNTGSAIMTPNCSNCFPQDSLNCLFNKLNVIHNRLRRYYCSCYMGEAYDIARRVCIRTTRECEIPCSLHGCVGFEEANCVSECPSPFVVKEVKGDYSTCECEGGGIRQVNGEWCSNEKSKSNKVLTILLATLLPLVVIVLLVVILCCCCYCSDKPRVEPGGEPKSASSSTRVVPVSLTIQNQPEPQPINYITTQEAGTFRRYTDVTPGCKLTILRSYSAKYKKIKKLFDRTMSGNYKNINIILLNNTNTKKRYDNYVNLLETEGRACPKTLLLFHGTSTVDPKKIYDGYYENFDVAHANAGLWGKGVYFATDASYSHIYAHRNNDGMCSMLVANVAVGNYYDYGTKYDTSLIHPPNLPNNNYKRYDSVSGITQGTRVYIIYSSNQAYSKYLITYYD